MEVLVTYTCIIHDSVNSLNLNVLAFRGNGVNDNKDVKVSLFFGS